MRLSRQVCWWTRGIPNQSESETLTWQIDERITPLQSLVMPKLDIPDDPSIITKTTTGETIRIIRKPDPKVIAEQLDALKGKGINSVAVAFVHSYLWGDHEEMVAKMARDRGFEVSVSSQLQPMVSTSSIGFAS